MKTLILFSIIVLTACTTQRTKDAELLKPVSMEAKNECIFIELITEDVQGRGSVGKNSKSAMNKALNRVAESGGDSYFFVSSDATIAGSVVVLESYKCK